MATRLDVLVKCYSGSVGTLSERDRYLVGDLNDKAQPSGDRCHSPTTTSARP
jgi:hypothetical protein